MRFQTLIAAAALAAGTTFTIADPVFAGSGSSAQMLAQAGTRIDAEPSANRKPRPPAAATPIACTRVGCQPIPRGCHIERELSFDGTPTGFDLVVCPMR